MQGEGNNGGRRALAMLAVDILLSGLVLGGMYALTALGLTLQYGVARIMNLSYGEFLVAAALAKVALPVIRALARDLEQTD